MEIPVVDLSKCIGHDEKVLQDDLKSAGEKIYKAFATVGFVYLKNTGVEKRSIDEVFSVSEQFFNLDVDVKRRYGVDEAYNGYVGLKVEGTNQERPPDLKEAYNICAHSLHKSETKWPNDVVPNFLITVKDFFNVCHKLSIRILELLTVAMDLKDKNYLLKSHSRMNGERNYTTLRSLHYPPTMGAEIEPEQIRLGEHSDYGSFTLLFQDQTGGLEVQSSTGEFFEAPPMPGTVLVNVGDIFQFWTQGNFKSVRHRILIPKDEVKKKCSRKSLVFSVHPDYEVPLDPLGCNCDSDKTQCANPSSYKPVTALEYVNRKLQNSYY